MTPIETIVGIKGMKSIIASGLASFVFGGLSFATALNRTWLNDLAAIVGIASAVFMIIYVRANTRKVNKEAWKLDLETDLLMSFCKNCDDPSKCVIKPEHRPPSCKQKTKT